MRLPAVSRRIETSAVNRRKWTKSGKERKKALDSFRQLPVALKEALRLVVPPATAAAGGSVAVESLALELSALSAEMLLPLGRRGDIDVCP